MDGGNGVVAGGMKNVAFLRTNIEIIERFFAEGEVSEIWLTFSDPQMKKATKRLLRPILWNGIGSSSNRTVSFT